MYLFWIKTYQIIHLVTLVCDSGSVSTVGRRSFPVDVSIALKIPHQQVLTPMSVSKHNRLTEIKQPAADPRNVPVCGSLLKGRFLTISWETWWHCKETGCISPGCCTLVHFSSFSYVRQIPFPAN